MSNFLRRLLPMLAVLFFADVQAQNFWRDAELTSFDGPDSKRSIKPEKFRSFTIDTLALKTALATAPMEFSKAAEVSPLIMAFPMPDGKTARFAVVESPMMESALAAQFPNIKTYSGQGVDDKTATLKMDWTEYGLHVQVLSPLDAGNYYVDPYINGEKTQYMSYFKKDLINTKTHIEQGYVEEQLRNINSSGLASRTAVTPCYGSTLRTYRLAVATTGQYAASLGATTVGEILSNVTTTVNRVNGIYEKEIAVRLSLIANNSQILYLSQTTPFSSYANGEATELINRSQKVIDSVIGNGNYDIGHTFSTGAGGLAQRGSVCVSSGKARGVTGSVPPTGDAYDVDFVAHEMGHQFGGNHTFNAVNSPGTCDAGNRNGSTSVEPGSGVTIMAYAGICGAQNLQSHSIPFFHTVSQAEIRSFLSGVGATCGTPTSTGNAIPVVNAGPNYIIPNSTPFVLTGSATDANNSEVLTYSWEEIDPGTSGGNWNSGNKPFFRSFNPTLTPVRYFPRLSDLVNDVTVIGENLPATAQTLNFTLTARDNRNGGGGVCSDDVIVTVDGGSGPFSITSQWGPETWVANGTNQKTITWSVAGTNAAPVNCANVSILFSTDGGLTFPYTIVASTPNDGSETITIPNLRTTNGRIMVKAVGNIFFDVNDKPGVITINSACSALGATVTPSTSVSAQAGNSALNLNLSPTYGSFVPAGTLTGVEPYASLSFLNTGSNTCQSASLNQFQYHSYTFKVSVSGTYTFTFSTSTPVLANLYSTSFNPNSVCTNFLTSTATWPGSGNVTLNASMSRALTAGTTYVLNIGTFSNTTPTLPATYKMNITNGVGGVAYQIGEQYSDPGAGFNYSYVIVNNSTGNIVAISSTSNLTNSTTFPAGQYTVYGISYSTSIANLNSYVGGSFNSLATQIQNNPSTFCADLSRNSVTVNVTGTFPVQFTALKARKQSEKVALDWGTASEQNSSHFLVQRSANGSDFDTQIGNVKAAGNSNSQLNYNFIDANPIKGWNYYRIKQIDLDGKFIYSNTAAVNFEKGAGMMLIYPNPAKDQLNIEYTAVRSGKLEIQVIDSKGAVLKAQRINVTTGRNIETINISTLAQGMYMLKYIDAEGNIAYTKFIKH